MILSAEALVHLEWKNGKTVWWSLMMLSTIGAGMFLLFTHRKHRLAQLSSSLTKSATRWPYCSIATNASLVQLSGSESALSQRKEI